MKLSIKEKFAAFRRFRWWLVVFDSLLYLGTAILLLVISRGGIKLTTMDVIGQMLIGWVCIFLSRVACMVYLQIWRYGGVQSYMRLVLSDAVAFITYYLLQAVLPVASLSFARCAAIVSMNLLLAITIRMVYRYAFQYGANHGFLSTLLNRVLKLFGVDASLEKNAGVHKINVAIIGAGRVGTALAEELMNNSAAHYAPRCFIDVDREMVGRQVQGIPVLREDEDTLSMLKKLEIQEIIFALPQLKSDRIKELYELYKQTGCVIKTYDYPIMQTAGKRSMRAFDIEELLFRQTVQMQNEQTVSYYRGKTILITGGGGSIGSEMSRQLAAMEPARLILLDIYENGVYDVQQELKIAYQGKLDLHVEIASITNRKALSRVFETWHPQVVVMAAAHKHVPLMETNVIEAVENNVFGTLNTVELSEKYGVERVIMVSTDKAVNPTNVMGATKRMCEMIVQTHSRRDQKTTFSTTRFGNVLGSAGSVIPLFRRQIQNGGPVTLTDKRIIRYFMTIPEASQLVLQSGAMAKNGELFVLDMGQPVKILDLAENMIRLSGMVPGVDIEILETGLRPGEKLYEELLIKSDTIQKTENELIFIEHDEAVSEEDLLVKLTLLHEAIVTGSDDKVREILHSVVPSYKKPEEVNRLVAAEAAK